MNKWWGFPFFAMLIFGPLGIRKPGRFFFGSARKLLEDSEICGASVSLEHSYNSNCEGKKGHTTRTNHIILILILIIISINKRLRTRCTFRQRSHLYLGSFSNVDTSLSTWRFYTYFWAFERQRSKITSSNKRCKHFKLALWCLTFQFLSFSPRFWGNANLRLKIS